MSHLAKISNRQKVSGIVEVFRIYVEDMCLQLNRFLRGNTDIYAYRTQLPFYSSKICPDRYFRHVPGTT